MKQITSPGSMHETGCSGLDVQGVQDDPEGWDGMGREVEGRFRMAEHPWLIHVNVWQNHCNIVKY